MTSHYSDDGSSPGFSRLGGEGGSNDKQVKTHLE